MGRSPSDLLASLDSLRDQLRAHPLIGSPLCGLQERSSNLLVTSRTEYVQALLDDPCALVRVEGVAKQERLDPCVSKAAEVAHSIQSLGIVFALKALDLVLKCRLDRVQGPANGEGHRDREDQSFG